MTDAASGDGAAQRVGEWTGAVDRFAAWLAEHSPFYRELRVPIRVPDDAPARLAYFWRTVGWVPGVGLDGYGDGIPPVRELGRAAADQAFRRWLGPECFAPAMELAEPTPSALWGRLPRRCWVLSTSVETYLCHGGLLSYVDEDAGDDPPLMEWNTREVGHEAGSVHPTVRSRSSVAYLMGNTLATLARRYGIRHKLPAPARPGPFAPVIPHFWQLGDGVWGMPDPASGGVDKLSGQDPAAIEMIVCQSARAYLDYLTGLPAELLPGHGIRVHGAHEINVANAKGLSPQRLAQRGFVYTERDTDALAAGVLDGIPVVACQRTYQGTSMGTSFRVAAEDYQAFRETIKREKIRVRHHGWVEPAHWWTEPDAAARARVAGLVKRAAVLAGWAGAPAELPAELGAGRAASAPSAPKRTRRVTPVAAADPAVEAAVRAEAAALRSWILAGRPGLELTPPQFAADEPPLVRALWEELGYNSELQDMLGWPDRESSEQILAVMLAQYRSRGYALRRTSLPKRLRLAWIDGHDDTSLMVTDEDTPVDDPPLLAVDAEEGEVEPAEEPENYLAWIGERAAWYAGDGQPTWTVRTQPPLSDLGTQPYPLLAPKIRQISPAIWASPDTDSTTIGAPRFRDLIDWIAQTTTVDRLELCGTYGRCEPAARIPLASFVPPAGLREWRAPSGDARCYAGLIDDVPVLINVGDRTVLFTPHADRQRARAVAVAAGWI